MHFQPLKAGIHFLKIFFISSFSNGFYKQVTIPASLHFLIVLYLTSADNPTIGISGILLSFFIYVILVVASKPSIIGIAKSIKINLNSFGASIIISMHSYPFPAVEDSKLIFLSKFSQDIKLNKLSSTIKTYYIEPLLSLSIDIVSLYVNKSRLFKLFY